MNDEAGALSVLSCGRGHLEIRFDKADAAEVEKAKRIIKDMLKRGYTILIEDEGQTKKVKRFDPDREVYIVDDAPAEEKPARKGGRKKGVPLRGTRATAIGPTAGG